jgi:hypothetical protein
MSPSPIEGYLPVIQHFIEFYYFVDKLYASGRDISKPRLCYYLARECSRVQ